MGAFIEHGPSADTSRQVADETLRKLGRLRAASDFELCQWFLCGFRLKVHDLYGFASFREYAERWFGCSGRGTEERVRVAMRLDELPKLSAAFAAGELVYSAVRELTRVADAETEAEWLEVADGKTASQIERMTSGKTPGDRPSDPTRPELERKRVTLNLSPSAYALLRQARDVLRKESGGTHLDDDAFIELLASSALSGGGGADETRSRHQIALTVCECCEAATQDANGEQVPVGPEVVEMAECDAQVIGRVDISAGYERASQVIPPAIRRAVVRRHGGVCAVPGCKNTSCDVHHCDPKSEGGSHNPERLVLLCSAHHGIVHGGKVVIRGTWSEGFVFEHPDGSGYGSPKVEPKKARVLAEVFQMLRALSFKEKEARRLVDQARPHVGAEMKAEQALRVALRGVSIGSGVREELAEYGARGAGERPPRGGFSGWALCGAPPRSYRTLLPMTAHGLAFH
ncbi:MAG: HNH endonuclease signature motif containing protein [Sandaracinaceae bacterium]